MLGLCQHQSQRSQSLGTEITTGLTLPRLGAAPASRSGARALGVSLDTVYMVDLMPHVGASSPTLAGTAPATVLGTRDTKKNET